LARIARDVWMRWVKVALYYTAAVLIASTVILSSVGFPVRESPPTLGEPSCPPTITPGSFSPCYFATITIYPFTHTSSFLVDASLISASTALAIEAYQMPAAGEENRWRSERKAPP